MNLAARLEREAKPGRVLMSYDTFAHVQNEIECEARGHISVKGIAYPVATYEAIAPTLEDAARSSRIRTELPHLRIEIDPAAMSEGELSEAAIALRRTLDLIESRTLQPRAASS